MTSLNHLLIVLTLLASSAAASAQPSPLSDASPSPARPSVPASIPALVVPSVPRSPMLAVRAEERSDVLAVRREIAALRMACAAMPAHIYIPVPAMMLPGSRAVPEPMTSRPYAPEEDTCAAVLNPDRSGPEYAVQMGVIGAGLTVLALMFFTLIAGVLRVLWNGPVARFLPAHFARRLHG